MPPVCSMRIHGRIYFIRFSNVFSQNLLIICVSLFLMLFSMFRSEPLAIACSVQWYCGHPADVMYDCPRSRSCHWKGTLASSDYCCDTEKKYETKDTI